MAMKHIEDMDEPELNMLVSVLLADDPKMAAELDTTPKEPFDFNKLVKNSSRGFKRGELNIICAGGITK